MIRKVLILLAIASTAVAQTEVTPYISFGSGYAVLENTEISASSIDILGFSFDDGYAIDAAAGLKFDQGMGIFPVRTELAFSYQNNDLDEIKDILGIIGPAGTKYSADGEAEILTLMVNGYIDILTGTSFTPYLLGGLGAANVDLDGEDDSVFAGQIGAGIGYALNQNIIVDLKYKYFLTEDIEIIDGTEMEISPHQLLLGIRYQF
jgi:opacity protein-like surface antigen